MNKAEIKQIILEEIENAMNDMASNLNNRELVDSLATILSVPDTEDDEIEGPGIEDLSPDPIFGPDPSYVEEMARPKETWVATPKLEALLQHFVGKGGVDGLTAAMERISNVLTKTQNVGFKSRAKKYQKRFFTDEAGNVDKAKLRQFAELLLNPSGFTQSDIQNFVGFKNSAQANAFKMKLYKAKLINVQQPQDDSEDVSESKKKLEFDFSQVETPEKLPIDVDEQDLMDNIKKELKSSAEDYSGDGDKETANQLKDAVNWVDKNSLKGKVTLEEVYNFLTEFHKQLPDDDKMFLHEPTILELIEDEFKPYVDTEKEYQEIVSSVKQYLSSKQPQTMSELEKYIKQQIKEDAGFGGASNLELKSAAKQIYQHFGSFAQAKILGRSADKSDRMKHFTAKGINPEEPYAVIFMNGSDVDPEEHLFVQIGAPSRDASKDAVAKIKAKFPKFEYKISESQSGKIFIANLVIKPGKTTSENKTTMSELKEYYIKKAILESDNRPEEKEKLDEVAAELVGQYGAEAVNGLYMLAGILGLPIAAVLASVADGDIDIDLKGTLKDLYKSAGDSVKSKARSLAKTLGLGNSTASLNENKTTMSELEKYIKQQIKEAKNPLAKKMKEIENQGRVAALETKLAAIAEMIEETQGRLTRIDEDNEFADMMDKNAVKEVRKQLKELEKAKGKLEKERAKMEGKVEKKKEPVVDEDAPIDEDIFDTAIDEIGLEKETFELNESILRFQKLAGLITESDIQKKKLSLKEEYSPEQEKAFDTLVHRVGRPNILIARRYSIQNNMGEPTLDWAEAVERGRKGGWFKDFWSDNLIKILASKPDLNSKDGEALRIFFSRRANDIKNDALRSARIFNDPQNKPDATEKLLIQDYESLAKAVDAYVKEFK